MKFNYKSEYLVFMHIPKCAGTSTWMLLDKLFSKYQYFEPNHTVNSLETHLSNGKKIRRFTIVRDPMQRFISFYMFVSRNKDHHLIKSYPDLLNSTLFDFVYLLSKKDKENFNLMTKFFCGSYVEEENANKAISMVGSFEYIGFTEKYDEFITWIYSLSNEAPDMSVTEKKYQVSNKLELFTQNRLSDALGLIKELNKEDMILYDFLYTELLN